MKMQLLSLTLFVVLYLLIFKVISVSRTVREPGLSVHIVDVGQGDAVYVEKDGQPVMLIDGGADYTVDRYLLDNNGFICQIPLIILSHQHSDHYIGLARMLERCKFVTLRFNDVTLGDFVLPEDGQLNHKNKIIKALNEDEFTINGVYIKILVPQKKISEIPKNLNDASVVVFIKYGDFEGLFMGDLESETQSLLDVTALKKDTVGQLDVLKMAHHGALNGFNRNLVGTLEPRYCVISVGAENTFGHPSPPVLESLEELGCEIIRTDKAGSVVLKSR